MTIRPLDDRSDILPVLSPSGPVSGPEAVVLLVRHRLNLPAGEWWEDPSRGCGILDMIRASRVTEQDVPALSSYLAGYVRSTPGVEAVEDVKAGVSGRVFSWSCRVLTASGSGEILYTAGL